MGKRYAFLVDTSLCIGCNACENACKNYYQQEASVHWRKVYYMQEKDLPQPLRVGVSLVCNHCDDPACLKACPAGAYSKDQHGLVRHDNDRCIGCKLCTMACPYNVPCYDKNLGKVTKCEMCADRLARGEEPVCVASCPMGAIRVIDLNDPENAQYADNLPGLPPVNMTKPATRFVLPLEQKQDWRAE